MLVGFGEHERRHRRPLWVVLGEVGVVRGLEAGGHLISASQPPHCIGHHLVKLAIERLAGLDAEEEASGLLPLLGLVSGMGLRRQ